MRAFIADIFARLAFYIYMIACLAVPFGFTYLFYRRYERELLRLHDQRKALYSENNRSTDDWNRRERANHEQADAVSRRGCIWALGGFVAGWLALWGLLDLLPDIVKAWHRL